MGVENHVLEIFLINKLGPPNWSSHVFFNGSLIFTDSPSSRSQTLFWPDRLWWTAPLVSFRAGGWRFSSFLRWRDSFSPSWSFARCPLSSFPPQVLLPKGSERFCQLWQWRRCRNQWSCFWYTTWACGEGIAQDKTEDGARKEVIHVGISFDSIERLRPSKQQELWYPLLYKQPKGT